jgi:hypothetical protein
MESGIEFTNKAYRTPNFIIKFNLHLAFVVQYPFNTFVAQIRVSMTNYSGASMTNSIPLSNYNSHI